MLSRACAACCSALHDAAEAGDVEALLSLLWKTVRIVPESQERLDVNNEVKAEVRIPQQLFCLLQESVSRNGQA